jgi:hypothetical protein
VTEKFSTGAVKRVATKPKKRKRREKMLMNSRPVARDAEIKGRATMHVAEQKLCGTITSSLV